MEQSRQKIRKNLVSGIIYQVVLIAISFILPRLYLENFGSAVNGVLSTIKQIFAYMCLLEAGVGLAATQALYKPIAENDREKASSILSATSRYYFRTGLVYASAVLIIAAVYSFAVPTGINSAVVFTIVILNALPSLFSYFIQAKYRILMEVDGRKYIINNSETLLQLFSNIGKVLVLLLTDSLILIQLVYCVLALVQLTYLYTYAKRRYKWLDLKAKPDFAAISQKKSVLVHQISAMVFNNTDIILLSFMCGFKTVSIYTIYNIFFSQVQTFITNLVSGFGFALGQMFHSDRKKFDGYYRCYETLFIMCSFIIYTLMAVFLLPLIQIYTSGIDDADYTNPTLLFLFSVMNILCCVKLPSNHVLEFSGMFKETRSHAVIEMTLNIAVSVLAIIKSGICGAIAGTITALIYRGGVMIYYANKKVLGRRVGQTYRLLIANGAVFAAVMALMYVDSFSGMSFGKLVINGIIHSLWISGLYIAVNLAVSKDAFSTFIGMCRAREKS